MSHWLLIAYWKPVPSRGTGCVAPRLPAASATAAQLSMFSLPQPVTPQLAHIGEQLMCSERPFRTPTAQDPSHMSRFHVTSHHSPPATSHVAPSRLHAPPTGEYAARFRVQSHNPYESPYHKYPFKSSLPTALCARRLRDHSPTS